MSLMKDDYFIDIVESKIDAFRDFEPSKKESDGRARGWTLFSPSLSVGQFGALFRPIRVCETGDGTAREGETRPDYVRTTQRYKLNR